MTKITLFTIIISCAAWLPFSQLQAQCTNPLACNYDATATQDDGSCVYFDTDIFALGEVMHTTTFVPNDDCPGGLDLANSYGFPVVGTPDAPIGFTITPEQAASLIENLGSLGELFAYEVANASMSFCGTSITVDLQIAPDFTSEWSGDYYPFTSLNTFGVPSSVAGAGCNDPVACNYEPCAGPDPSLCTYPEAGLDCDGNALGCGDDEDQLTISYDGLDGFASEFTFTVADESGMELGSGAGAGTFDICIPAGACVTVMLMDEYGDGQYGWGAADGTTTISLNGEVVETFTGNWGDSVTAVAGGCPDAAGCTAELACNYNPLATEDDGSCLFSDATEFDVMDGFFLGFYDAESGCPNQVDLAGDLFYPVQLTENGYMFDVDEGLLGYLQFVLGPDLGLAFYNESVNNIFSICDNQLNVTNSPLLGSITSPWTSPTFSIDFLGFNLYWYPASLATFGCTEETACNYDATPCIVPDATMCEYAAAGFDCVGNPLGGLTCDEGEVSLAVNYDGADGWAEEFTFALTDGDGNVLGTGADAGFFEFCVPADACIVVTLNDSYGDGQTGGEFAPDGTTTVFYNGEVLESVTGNWGSSATILAGNCTTSAGCMDAMACNYDATATEADGSCVYFDTDIFALGEVMHTTTFAPNDACPGGLALAHSYGFPVVGTPDAPIGFTITPEQAASLIENLGSLGELFAYEVANTSMSFCGTTITADLQIAPDFTSEWSGDYYPFTSLNTFGVPSSIAGAGCNDPVACNYEPCAGPDPSLCTYPEAGLDCDGNASGCMNPESCNFDADALIDDGSCLSLDVCGVCGGPGLPDVFALDAVAILDEASMGDFSTDALNPTVVAFAGEGAYVLSGDAANFQTAADIEYFSMTVPAGYVISGVRMLAFDQTGYEPAGSPAGNGGFLGVGSGSTLPVIASPEDFVVAANALDGGALVGVMGGTTVGFGLLDDLAQPFELPEYGINIAGISGSLTAGTYTFMFKEGNSHPETVNASVHWSFAIEVSATSTNHYMTIVDCDGCLNDADGDGVCDELEVVGCTDMSSCNYNPMATDDDGSCGDTPEAASLCGEGTEWSNETCGCVALPDNCPSDIDGDGATTTTDLLLLLQNFATDCQN